MKLRTLSIPGNRLLLLLLAVLALIPRAQALEKNLTMQFGAWESPINLNFDVDLPAGTDEVLIKRPINMTLLGVYMWTGSLDSPPATGVTDTYNYGDMIFKGELNSATLDTALTLNKTVDGIPLTFYKIKNTTYDAYVAISQKVYNLNSKSSTPVSPPYTMSDEFQGSFKRNNVGECSNTTSNSPGPVGEKSYCRMDSHGSLDYVEIYGSDKVSGTGTVYLYMPKAPPGPFVLAATAVSSMSVSASIAKNTLQTPSGAFTKLSDIVIGGTIKGVNTCSVKNNITNQTIDLNSGSSGGAGLSSMAFGVKGGVPAGFTPMKVTVNFVCEGDIEASYPDLSWMVMPAPGALTAGIDGTIVAKPTGNNQIEGLGVKMTTDSTGNTPVIFGERYPAVVNSKDASATLYAYPTKAGSDAVRGGGDYTASAIIMLDIP